MRTPYLTLLALAVSTSITENALAQNDDCPGAILVAQGANGPYTNAGSTTSFLWNCAFGDNDVWFLYVAPGNGTLVADTCGSGFDTVMELFDGTGGCGALVSVDCNDDSCGLQSSVSTPVTTGSTWYMRVGGYAGQIGPFTLNISGPTGTGTVATATSVGAGCIAKYTSFYQNFVQASAFDLNGSAMTLFRVLPGYVAVQVGTFMPPSGGASVLPLLDDDELTQPLTTAFPYDGGSATSLTICSNGFVSVNPGNFTNFVPSVSELLNDPETSWRSWHDYNTTEIGSGQIKFEQIGSVAVITWDGVWDYGGTSVADASTFQFQFDSSNGSIALVWQTMSPNGGATLTGFLVGYSPGGPSANPGQVDISVALPLAAISTVGADLMPLSLTSVSRPVTGSNWTMQTGNIPATGVIGVEILGLSNPGIPDLTIIGMPACGLYTSLDLLNGFPVAGSTHNWGPAIPANPSLINQHVFASSAVFQVPPVNAFGAISSNGIDGKIGNL
ncbi:MAG: hypothetical protein ABIP94_21420 [Planctomycetota bacterium]